jgi:hypothetical protein
MVIAEKSLRRPKASHNFYIRNPPTNNSGWRQALGCSLVAEFLWGILAVVSGAMGASLSPHSRREMIPVHVAITFAALFRSL